MKFILLALIGWGWISPAYALDEATGERLFKRVWVPAPSSTKANDGLGPLFDGRSCSACHPNGERPVVRLQTGQELPRSFVVKLGNDKGEPDPIYGKQLQREAVSGVPVEAKVQVAKGLSLHIHQLGYGAMASTTRHHLRLAPRLKGLGLIDAIADDVLEAEVLKQARQDKVHGRLHRLDNGRIGRFGFKAQDADLMSRIAAAFSSDMGLSTALHADPAGDCTMAQTQCRNAPHGAPDHVSPFEIDTVILGQIGAFLSAMTALPRQPHSGEAIFHKAQCSLCHSDTLTSPPIYSDLLLHDMGEALSSHAREGDAGPTEWRTTPLIGLGQTLKSGGRLLHDGRAVTLDEAIERHGGDAAGARQTYRDLSASDKAALTAFLSTL